MRRFARVIQSAAAVLLLLPGAMGGARAADLSQPVMLVASARLADSPYAQSVVLVAPLPNGGHIGFIVNRPTTVKLETLFPEDGPARNVAEPVYLGGPVLPTGLFVLTRNAPEGGTEIPMAPGLIAVLDGATIDHIIQTAPNDARYFVGLMMWQPDELEDEISQGAWDVRAADADTAFEDPAKLWKSLQGTLVTSGEILVARAAAGLEQQPSS
jgi:putative transcriptional regulator